MHLRAPSHQRAWRTRPLCSRRPCAVVLCRAARSRPPEQRQEQQQHYQQRQHQQRQERQDERAPGPGRGRGSQRAAGNAAAADATRRVCIEHLLRIEQEGAFSGLVSGAVEPHSRGQQQRDADDVAADDEQQALGASLSPQQQRTLRSLVSGVVRWQRRLDYIASQLMQRSALDLDPPAVRQVLRLALYELLYARLAPHALGEFVDLTRAVVGGLAREGEDGAARVEGLARLVNGVLRSAARHAQAGTLPVPERDLHPSLSKCDLARVLGACHSHPTWLITRWLKQFGREGTEALLKVNNRPPVFTVRVNTLRTSAAALAEQLRAQGVDAAPSPLLPDEFLQVNSGLQTLLAMGHVAEGRCTVQDVSSGLVVALALRPQPGERVLDCCAAPGGKTMFAAARMGLQGSITAVDVSRPRTKALANLAATQGVPPSMLQLHAADLAAWAADAAAQGKRFDRVLLDAPCSGTGVLSKRADMRWRRRPEDLETLKQLQASLLDAAASVVKPGGVLVYSTCSLELDEDEGQVAAFLERQPDFTLQPIEPPPGAAQAAVVTEAGHLRTLPHVHRVDGIFAARLVRSA